MHIYTKYETSMFIKPVARRLREVCTDEAYANDDTNDACIRPFG